jgi:hypothetical protein
LKVDKALQAEMAKDNTRVNNAYNIANKSSEADALVDLARQGILAGQSSGNVISYNPLAI